MNRKTKNKQILSTPPPVLGVGGLEKRRGLGRGNQRQRKPYTSDFSLRSK
jgi:hypothetical protein